MKIRLGLVIVIALVAVLTSCKKNVPFQKTSAYIGDPADYFLPLQVGKYAIYRLDSVNFYNFGQQDTTTSYLAKDSVESSVVDGTGATAWLVTRYLSDTAGDGWAPSQTYTVTATTQTLQMTENNLRYIKLAYPIEDGFSWSGNSYLPYAPYQDFAQFSDDSHLNVGTWNYTYQDVSKPYALGSVSYDSTATVIADNDSINVPILDPLSFASRTYWAETYAKHIGLLYRHTEIWEWQPPTPDGAQPGYYIGFEVTMSLLSHN
jgi:hypothetical protein